MKHTQTFSRKRYKFLCALIGLLFPVFVGLTAHAMPEAMGGFGTRGGGDFLIPEFKEAGLEIFYGLKEAGVKTVSGIDVDRAAEALLNAEIRPSERVLYRALQESSTVTYPHKGLVLISRAYIRPEQRHLEAVHVALGLLEVHDPFYRLTQDILAQARNLPELQEVIESTELQLHPGDPRARETKKIICQAEADKTPIVAVFKQHPRSENITQQVAQTLQGVSESGACLRLVPSDVPAEIFKSSSGIRALALVAKNYHLVSSAWLARKILPALKDPAVRTDALAVINSTDSRDPVVILAVAREGLGRDSYESLGTAIRFLERSGSSSNDVHHAMAKALAKLGLTSGHELALALLRLGPKDPDTIRLLVRQLRVVGTGLGSAERFVLATIGQASPRSPEVLTILESFLAETRARSPEFVNLKIDWLGEPVF